MLYTILGLIIINLKYILGSSDIKSLGCWIRQENNVLAISSLESRSEYLRDNWWERKDPIVACAKAAAALGYNVFAVSNRGNTHGGECFSSCSASHDFALHGSTRAKCAYGTGGYTSMDVYSLDLITYMGCIKNKLSGYAIPDLEATHPALFGQPHNRQHSIEICGAIARSRGYNVFGITKGGRCLGSGDAYQLYHNLSKSGSGKDCQDEKGSEHSISVHLITGIVEFEKDSSVKRENFQKSRNKHTTSRRKSKKQRKLKLV